jgi:PAS domain S-box-containing protein
MNKKVITDQHLIQELNDLKEKYNELKLSYDKIISAGNLAENNDKMELELRESQTILRKSKEQYDDLVSKIPVGIYLLRSLPDRSFVLDYVSPRMAEMFDTTVTELLSDVKLIYKKIYPEDQQSFIKLNEDGIIYCKPFNWIGRVFSKGTLKWLNVSSAPEVQKNGDILWHGIVVDITDRKLAEDSLVDSERLLRESQNIARLGSFVWDIASNLWKSSVILDEIFGIDKNFIRSYEGWIDIIRPDFREMMNNYVTNDILVKHHKFDKEYSIVRKSDGEVRWVHGISELEFDKNDQPARLIGIIVDITERRIFEDEIKELNLTLEQRVNERTYQLEAANRELQAFAYSVSHDLRAPLRAIDGFSRFVLEDYSSKLDAEGQRFLGLIRSNTQKMDKLITDILCLSRITRGEQNKSDIDMTKMAASMFNESVSSENADKVRISIDNLPGVYADPIYIKQVWLNLLSNAIKFSAMCETPEIKIGGYSEDGFNIYYVSDNGVGFNPEYAHKLFGVFQRLHKSDEFEGTGVGLAIVQRIVHRHLGKVWATGKEGQGASFYFSLPVKN